MALVATHQIDLIDAPFAGELPSNQRGRQGAKPTKLRLPGTVRPAQA